MIGVYRHKDGRTFEREYAGVDEVDGARLWKLRTGKPKTEDGLPFRIKRAKYHITSQCFMEWEGLGEKGKEAPAYDREGNPAFETEYQAKEFSKKHGMHYGDRGAHNPGRW